MPADDITNTTGVSGNTVATSTAQSIGGNGPAGPTGVTASSAMSPGAATAGAGPSAVAEHGQGAAEPELPTSGMVEKSGSGALAEQEAAVGDAMAAAQMAATATASAVMSEMPRPAVDGINGRTPVLGDVLEADILASGTVRQPPAPSNGLGNETKGLVLIVLAVIAAFGVALCAFQLLERGIGFATLAEFVSTVVRVLVTLFLAGIAFTLLKLGIAEVQGRSHDPTENGGFGASLLGSALLALSVGAIVMTALWRFQKDIVGMFATPPPAKDTSATLPALAASPAEWPLWNEIAVAAGIAASVATVLIYRKLDDRGSAPDRANPWQYGELSARRDYLAASLKAYCPGQSKTATSIAACAEAESHIQQIGVELGLIDAQTTNGSMRQRTGSADKWILGTGFVELWQRLHAAEAALFGQRPLAQRLSYGRQDMLRLNGCELETESDLTLHLKEAIAELERISADGSGNAQTLAEAQPTEILISVHKTIDDFRDKSRAGLARTRVHLIWAGIMTAVVAYVLLALAILDDVTPSQIIAGGAFFLVGAVAGLIWQLRYSGSTIRSGEDDFGLDLARLIYVPVLSGLAGVGGVLLMAMLYPTLNVVFDPDSSNVGKGVPQIPEIFDLYTNRFGLVVAAVFGLTPDLLINRLQGQADQYRTQLAATSPQTRSNDTVDVALIEQLRSLIKEEFGSATVTSDSGSTSQTDRGADTASGSAGAGGAGGATGSTAAGGAAGPVGVTGGLGATG